MVEKKLGSLALTLLFKQVKMSNEKIYFRFNGINIVKRITDKTQKNYFVKK